MKKIFEKYKKISSREKQKWLFVVNVLFRITLVYDDSFLIYQKLTDIEILINKIQLNFTGKSTSTIDTERETEREIERERAIAIQQRKKTV